MSNPADGWQIRLARQPERLLRRLPNDLLRRFDLEFQALSKDPRPPGCKKLTGWENLYRLRMGDWRISYAIEEGQLVILILEIAPRGDAYRRL